jgi:hypothetical protein
MVEILYMFSGTKGAMAYSIDKTGANLPIDHAPWKFRREVPTDGPTFAAGADKHALEQVKKDGFSVTVFETTIDGLPIEEFKKQLK